MEELNAEQLPNDIEQLKNLLLNAQKSLRKKDRKIQSLYQLITAYQEAKRLSATRQFSPSSEKESLQQRLFNEAESDVDTPEEAVHIDTSTEVKAHKRRGGRKKLPDHLPRLDIIHDLSDDEKRCACGCEQEKIGEDITEQIDIVPAKVRVLKHIRYKYACKHCDNAPKVAAMPPQPIPKSQASPGFLAYVATSKYADALPLYRQCNILKRGGVEYARNTLSHQVVKAGELVQPLINLMEEKALSYPVLQMDETTVQVLREPDKTPQSKSYMWVMRGGPPEQSSIIYHYDPGRGQAVPSRLLAGYQGYLQTDAWHAYDAVHGKDITAVACWAHARRKFKDAEKALPKVKQKRAGKIQQALAYIKKLYAIEKRMCNVGNEARLEARQTESLDTLEAFKAWLDKQPVNPESLLGKAISYTLKYWDRLIEYCNDARIEIDNNGIENKIRPFAVGRKNWLFSATQSGARASANLYSLIETAKANGLNEYDYLKWVFTKLPAANTVEEVEALLPWNQDRTELVNWVYA
ncbi:IS66-like element ISPsy5 family transposase (plasmid) [Maricurvus nonylphenolicus]|uniref:IS66 family transposase n=1 Tax=Maricurvus nonylphenolicus TaxID=1008307 RepID=UPI0036F2D886